MTTGIRNRLVVLTAGLIVASAAAQAGPKPNIIVIYADDMGYGDCTANNPESKIRTPHIDQLAEEGIRFTDAHSPAATCTASRYGLLTGTNPARRGVVNGLTGLGAVIDKDEVTIADLLRAQGYVTRMVGKWHLGFRLHGEGPKKAFDFSKPLIGGPLDCGFDSYFGVRKAIASPPYFFIKDRAPAAKPAEHTLASKRTRRTSDKDPRTVYRPGDTAPGFVHEACNATLCDDVVRIIKEHAASGKSKPLFLYYAMLEPHTPWLPTKEFVGKSQAGTYGDYIVQLDHEVGRVLGALKESGLDRNTLVVFSSDNGAMWRLPDIERFGHRANGIFSGTKGTAWEGGHRVPFIVKWPGKVPASTVSGAVINHSDLFATLADLFKVDVAKTYPGSASDSYSFAPVLEDPRKEHRRPGMVVARGGYRSGDWKLRFRQRGANPVDYKVSGAVLHDLSKDPTEETDLSESHSETKARLFAAYQQFIADRNLKPLAVQFLERKSRKTGRSRKPQQKTPSAREGTGRKAKGRRPGTGVLRVPQDADLTENESPMSASVRKRQ